jgi:hypothetical protein
MYLHFLWAIDTVSKQEGSWVSNLTVSFGEIQTFAYPVSSLLVLIWLLFMCGFRACRYFHYKL